MPNRVLEETSRRRSSPTERVGTDERAFARGRSLSPDAREWRASAGGGRPVAPSGSPGDRAGVFAPLDVEDRQRDEGTVWPASPILVATAFDEPSDVALRRGYALAQLLHAQLVVVHVFPSDSWLNLLVMDRYAMDAVAVRQLMITAVETTRAWAVGVLGSDATPPDIILKRGHVARAVLGAANDVEASLIVLGDSRCGAPAKAWHDETTATVIRNYNGPVLVARPERTSSSIVAATNFADLRYPALRQAARLGARLGAHVTFVHNIEGEDHSPTDMSPAGSDGPTRSDAALSFGRYKLEVLAEAIGADIEAVVMGGQRTVDAILSVARLKDADLVVVGATRHRRATEGASLGTAVAVATEARRSVLTVPIARPRRGHPPRSRPTFVGRWAKPSS